MAKKNEVKIGLKVDDKGSLKKTAKSARSVDRNLKGAAQASSNSTKNFSKMAQGISGGLVPAYATLAATMFAVGAVFRAFQKASDLRVQMDAMKAMGAATGRNMGIVAKSLQNATGHQIAFKEATEASAIALSAGFSGTQVAQIGKMAKQTSAALGRDFQDTFDRLLKGISKAEPELLDELGIVLRLEKATTDYASAIGKSAKDLTAFERQQAVMNNVLQQASEKYGDIDVKINRVNAVAAKFQDIADGIMRALAPIIEFLADTLAASTGTAMAAIGVFVAYIIGKMIPSWGSMISTVRSGIPTIAELKAGITNMVTSTVTGVNAASAAFGRLRANIKTAGAAQRETGAAASGKRLWTGSLEGTKSKTLQAFKGGGALNARQVSDMKKMIANFKNQEKGYTGFLKGQAKWRVNIWSAQLRYQQTSFAKSMAVNKARAKLAWQGISGTVKIATKTMVTTVKLGVKSMQLAYKGLGLTVKAVSMGMNAAMRAAGFIGLIMLIWDLFQALRDHMDKILLSISKILKFIGDKIEAFGEKIASFLEAVGLKKLANMTREAAAGIAGKIAGERNPETGERSGGWAGRAQAKGEQLAGGLESKRQTDALTASIKDFTDGLVENNAELRANAKLLDNNALKIANFVGSSGAMGNLLKLEQVAKKGAGKNISTTDAFKEFTEGLDILGTATGDTGGMSAIKDLVNAGKWEEARTALLKFTNTWGSHAAAVQAAKDITETYDKQLASIVIKSPTISKHYEGLNNLLTNVVETTKDLTQSDIVGAMERLLGEDAVKRIGKAATEEERRAIAIEEVTAAIKRQLDLVLGQYEIESKLNALRLEGVRQSKFGGGFGKFLQRENRVAQAELLIAQKENEFNLKYGPGSDFEKQKRDADTERLNMLNAQKQGALELLEISKAQIEVYEEQGTIAMQIAAKGIDGMVSSIHAAITGTKSLKQAFGEMAISILSDLSKMILEQHLFNALSGFLAGPKTKPPATGADPEWSGLARTGGVFRPPGYKTFAAGGIASGPGSGYNARLHGTEAVVPLPNGKTIPVEIKGGSGAQNVVVNVNIDSDGNSSQQINETTGQEALQMGKLISVAVTRELQKQKRQGGMLSPHGIA